MVKKLSNPIVEKAFLKLLTQDLRAEKYNGIDSLPNYLQCPIGIGGISYKDDVTAYRITGADRGYPQVAPRDVPQNLIDLYCRSFAKGLHLILPSNTLVEYECLTTSMCPFISNRPT